LDCEVNGDVSRDTDGQPNGMVFVLRDIRKRKNAEKELIKYWLHLEELIVKRTRKLVEINKLLEEKIAKQGNGEKTPKYKVGENILFKLHNSTILIAVERIKYITANNQYTSVVLDDNRHVLIRRSIAKWEALLPENIFLRIHRSTIINTKYINKIENCNNKHNAILKNTSKSLEISRRYFKKLDIPVNENSGNF
jgi:two-component system LytT family response regulator